MRSLTVQDVGKRPTWLGWCLKPSQVAKHTKKSGLRGKLRQVASQELQFQLFVSFNGKQMWLYLHPKWHKFKKRCGM